MSEKHRNLPLWMVKSDVQSSKDNDAIRKKTPGTTNKTVKKQCLKSVITYWMNERELVESALSFLKKDEACGRTAVKLPEVGIIIPETDAETSDSDVHDSVLYTDCDIAEQETVPFGNCMEESTSAKLGSHLKLHLDGLGTSEKKPQLEDISQKPDADEALELVREIFFT
ncbi:uncharacterized protein si:ch211-127m7.2 [Myxocyprinus asiaticus]|uniref:uncharacterized protein si:ch211-127m7.2 n=1 Tax=Myxocyprinus asiaticus TaxID=70543 RepID=UPI002223876D|nr:uncharacterized protein si:ch211-127m7.2 [Myxocyprinus asiaticus]